LVGKYYLDKMAGGDLSQDEALQILSQSEVHMHDLVDMWVPASGPTARIGRGFAGFIGDVFADPLTYLTMGTSRAAEKVMTTGIKAQGIAGRTLKTSTFSMPAVDKLSKAEKANAFARGQVIDILTQDGERKAFEAVQAQANRIAQGIPQENVGGIDLKKLTQSVAEADAELGGLGTVSPSQAIDKIAERAGYQISDQARAEMMTVLGNAQKGAPGYVAGGKSIYMHVPFTNLGYELPFPIQGAIRMPIAGIVGFKNGVADTIWTGIDRMADSSNAALASVGGVMKGSANAVSNAYRSMLTDTSRPIFNWGKNQFYAAQSEYLPRVAQSYDEMVALGLDDNEKRLLLQYLETEPVMTEGAFEAEVKAGLVRKAKLDEEAEMFGTLEQRPVTPIKYQNAGVKRKVMLDPTRPATEKLTPIVVVKDGKRRKAIVDTAKLDKELDRRALPIRYWTGLDSRNPILSPDVNPSEFTPIKFVDEQVKFTDEQLLRAQIAYDEAGALYQQMTPRTRDVADRILRENREMLLRYKAEGMSSFSPLNFVDAAAGEATGYVKHMVRKEWLKAVQASIKTMKEGGTLPLETLRVIKGANLDGELADAALEFIGSDESLRGLISGSEFQRSYRGSIEAANKRSMELFNEPMFVDDPILAHASRMLDMEKNLALRGLAETMVPLVIEAGTKNIPRGYAKLNLEELFGIKSGNRISYEAFLPDELVERAYKNGGIIYVPEDVATRFVHIYNQQAGKTAAIIQAAEKFNSLYRPVLLYGTGYLGQNFFSNLLTHTQLRNGDNRLFEALLAAKSPEKFKNKVFKFGDDLEMTADEFIDTARRNGILGTSFINDTEQIEQVYQGLRDASVYRQKATSLRAMTGKITLYEYMARASAYTDDAFKLANFMSRLDEGYSIAGAVEHTNMWFYNFKDVSPGLQKLRALAPFAQFTVKTAERMAKNVKDLEFVALTMPAKVHNVLEGAFVEDYDTRNYIMEYTPVWSRDMILGPALPGGKYVMLEVPWASNTAQALMNPTDNASPLFKLMATAYTVWSNEENPNSPAYQAIRMGMGDEGVDPAYEKFVKESVALFAPPPLKEAALMVQMQNPDAPRSLVVEAFGVGQVNRNTSNINDILINPGEITEVSGGRQARAYNMATFGKYLRENSDLAFEGFFYGKHDWNSPENAAALLKRDAMYAQYIKSRFRDLSFGLARVSDLDNNFIINFGAMQRYAKVLDGQIRQEMAKSGTQLYDPAMLQDEKRLKEAAKVAQGRLKELLLDRVEVQYQADALSATYGYFIHKPQEKQGIIESLREAMGARPLSHEERQELEQNREIIRMTNKRTVRDAAAKVIEEQGAESAAGQLIPPDLEPQE
jgi:hypothetical protein